MATAVAASPPPYWKFYQDEQARASSFSRDASRSLMERVYWQEQARWAYRGVHRTHWAMHAAARVAAGQSPCDGSFERPTSDG